MCIKPASYRTHSDFRRLVLREMKNAGGNAAKRNRFQLITGGCGKNRPIAGSQPFLILPGEPPGHNRSNRMNHIARGKVISRRDLCRAGLFLMALRFHDLITRFPQFYTCHSVNHVLYSYPNHTWRQHLLWP